MKAGFEVRNQFYEVELDRTGREEHGFEICEIAVRGPDRRRVQGILKLTVTALAVAEHLAAARGTAAEEWLARGCARSLAAEVALRRLRPGFSLIVDHRWMTEHEPAV